MRNKNIYNDNRKTAYCEATIQCAREHFSYCALAHPRSLGGTLRYPQSILYKPYRLGRLIKSCRRLGSTIFLNPRVLGFKIRTQYRLHLQRLSTLSLKTSKQTQRRHHKICYDQFLRIPFQFTEQKSSYFSTLWSYFLSY
jgi:hypothetical protein